MKNVDPRIPMYYEKTGQPVELVAIEPLVQYRVRYSNGNEAVLTASDLERQMTNEPMKYQFMQNFSGCINLDSSLGVRADKNTVAFTTRRQFGAAISAELPLEQVRQLSEKLARWVQERDGE